MQNVSEPVPPKIKKEDKKGRSVKKDGKKGHPLFLIEKFMGVLFFPLQVIFNLFRQKLARELLPQAEEKGLALLCDCR